MITTHRLPQTVFGEFAAGGGDQDAIRYLCEAQQSKHMMLLHAIAEEADGAAIPAYGKAAFWAGYALLTQVQATDPGTGAWLLSLPNLGGWAHDCLVRPEQGLAPDLAHITCFAAAAAVHAGIPFEIDVPVLNERVQLPGLGSLRIAGQSPWITLRSDGEWLTGREDLKVACRDLVPDDGSTGSAPQWYGTPAVRAVADGLTWDVRLETGDLYLDRYTLPMSTNLPAGEIDHWRRRIQSAWEVLVRHHRSAAEPLAASVSVVVPLTAQRDTDLVSATSPAAFGAIATSWPPDSVTMAETLVHEFQHVKLCGLMDMVPLVKTGGDLIYAPWRQDPRPAGGLLQGVYAHLEIARFWHAQRQAEIDPDDILRAQVLFARWRSTIDPSAHALLEAGCLTRHGVRFAEVLQDQGRHLKTVHVPDDAERIAEEVALDHRLTWQLRHVAFAPAEVARLATAYQQGQFFTAEMRPRARIKEDTRKVGSTVRTQLLNMRYLAPVRYRELCAAGVLPLSEADVLLINGKTSAAVQAYRDQIVGSADPLPDAWIGLALALHQLSQSPVRQAFATHLAVMFDMHAYSGGRRDPLDLAGWLT